MVKGDNEVNAVEDKDLMEIILADITDFYLHSRDFNGFPILQLVQKFEITTDELKSIMTFLIKQSKISLTFGVRHPNPHIKAFWEEPEEAQIEKLMQSDLHHVCAYPLKIHLETVVDSSEYVSTPFTHRLALGEPQLSFLSFDLSVLEYYRNDPRYFYDNDDVTGWIGIHDEFIDKVRDSDRILLETFGFSYDENYARAAAVFLIYLSRLSPEHQQLWNAKIVEGVYKLHPDYARISSGRFREKASIFEAFLEELFQINEMCKLMKRPPLFRDDLKNTGKPRQFAFLLRTTLKEYNDFILLLDQLISDNINKKFFLNDISLEFENKRKDGNIEVTPKGTITLLSEWMEAKIVVKDDAPNNMIKTFRKIRRLRQNPAHKVNENIFDPQYFQLQREIIIEAYEAIRLLRLIFANHPSVKEYNIPDWLKAGDIWTY